jgi:hypothetical protein
MRADRWHSFTFPRHDGADVRLLRLLAPLMDYVSHFDASHVSHTALGVDDVAAFLWCTPHTPYVSEQSALELAWPTAPSTNKLTFRSCGCAAIKACRAGKSPATYSNNADGSVDRDSASANAHLTVADTAPREFSPKASCAAALPPGFPQAAPPESTTTLLSAPQ